MQARGISRIITMENPARISYRRLFLPMLSLREETGGGIYRPKRPLPPGELNPDGGADEDGGFGCCGRSGRLGFIGSRGAGVRLLGGAGAPNAVPAPDVTSPCGPPENDEGFPGLTIGPLLPWESE